ncbi:MAG: hypothetical protein U0X76_00205 [Bacteroidia bacterium]
MKKLSLLILLFIAARASGQSFYTEEAFRNYFAQHADSLDQIEGIWQVSTTLEYYHYDTLYDVEEHPKGAKVAIILKEGKYLSYNLSGEPYDVEFSTTDVKGVYLYRNYFPLTKSYSKTSAVISKRGEMEYTYTFPDDYLRAKLGDSYEEGTRVVNILKWTRVFPEK